MIPFSLFSSWDGYLLLPSDIRVPASRACELWNLHQWPPGSPAFGLRLNSTTGSPSLQLAVGRSRDFSASISAGTDSYNQLLSISVYIYNYIYIYIYMYISICI